MNCGVRSIFGSNHRILKLGLGETQDIFRFEEAGDPGLRYDARKMQNRSPRVALNRIEEKVKVLERVLFIGVGKDKK